MFCIYFVRHRELIVLYFKTLDWGMSTTISGKHLELNCLREEALMLNPFQQKPNNKVNSCNYQPTLFMSELSKGTMGTHFLSWNWLHEWNSHHESLGLFQCTIVIMKSEDNNCCKNTESPFPKRSTLLCDDARGKGSWLSLLSDQ